MANFNIMNDNWNNNIPEFEIEGFWGCDIVDGQSISPDGKGNSIKVSDYFPKGVDIYISSVTIPQLSLDYENNEFGLMSFKEKSKYDDVTLNFYDDLRSSCKSFFTDWLHSVFDEQKHALLPNWRYEAKDLFVSYYRPIYHNINNNEIKITSSYRIVKCLPKSISEISTEEETGSRKAYSVILACQRVESAMDKLKFSSSNTVKYNLN